MRGALFSVIFLFSTFGVTAAQTYRFSVKHGHALGSCKGNLIISHEGIRYETTREKDQRAWQYKDIQQVRLLSHKELAVITYEDRRLKLGADKIFRFEILEGEISNRVYQFLLENAGKPVVSKLSFVATKLDYQIPAKHLHRFGGCQGTLAITPDGIVYQTGDEGESRTWRYSDIESIGPMDPFHLRITTNESAHFRYAGRKDFNFVLKERMDEKLYEYVWGRIYGVVPSAQNEN